MSTISLRFADYCDSKAWDAYVSKNFSISPYCHFAWKKAVTEAYGFQGYYLLAVRGHDVAGVFPLVHLKVPFGPSTLVSLPYCDTGGVHAEDEETGLLMLQAAIQLCAQLGAGNLLVRSERQSYPPEFMENYNYSVEYGKVIMRLELPSTVDALWNGFKSKLRSQIVKAEKNGLAFQWVVRDGLNEFYSVLSRNMRELGSPVHGVNWFKSVVKHYGEAARIGLVYKGSKAVGCGLILCGTKTVAIPWASTLRDYNSLNPNMLLYWNILKFSIENNYKEFDFGRSTPGEGTYKFKKQWGATERMLYTHSFKHKPCQAKSTGSIVQGRKTLAAIWSKLPLPVANALGPVLRKYISL